MEMIKCPGCGTNTSAKRQICHMCGHLLSEPQPKAQKETMQLVSDDLRAAAEAAMRETARPSRQPAAAPTAASASAAAITKHAPARAPREARLILILAIITVVALGWIAYYLGSRHLASRNAFTRFAPTPSAAPSTPSATLPRSATRPPAPQLPALPNLVLPIGPKAATPTTTPPKASAAAPPAPLSAADKEAALTRSALKTGRPLVEAALPRVNAALGTAFTIPQTGFYGTVSQQNEDTAVVTVSFQGSGFYGAMDILLRRFDRGWQSGWEASHYKDLRLTFTPPVTVRTDQGSQTCIEANFGTGGFEPLSSLREQQPDFRYQ